MSPMNLDLIGSSALFADGDLIRSLINERSNGGNEIVLDTSYFNDRILVRKGDIVPGTLRFRLMSLVTES